MVADIIKLLRKQSNLTQSELAKRLNITRSSVNAWKMGISVPSTQYVVELANIFRVSTDYILGIKKEISVNIDNLSAEQIKIVYLLIQYFGKDKS